MKKLLVILLALGIVAAVAYILGTDAGRARRDALLARAGKARSAHDDVVIDVTSPSSAPDDDVQVATSTG